MKPSGARRGLTAVALALALCASFCAAAQETNINTIDTNVVVAPTPPAKPPPTNAAPAPAPKQTNAAPAVTTKKPFTPASFRTRPGFKVELVASDPSVSSPVAMAFDEDGKLYV